MSNVYYLPVPAAVAVDIVGSRPVPGMTVRQARVPTAPDARQRALLAEHAALLGAHVARPVVPAHVVDLEAARARRATP